MYDIIYSILAHESPECVIDMINNINYFNRDLNIFIIILKYFHCKVRKRDGATLKLRKSF